MSFAKAHALALSIATALLASSFAPVEAAPPASCAYKFVGTWVYPGGTTVIAAGGTAYPKCPMCVPTQTWTCQGNTYLFSNSGPPGQFSATLSADGRQLIGGGTVATRVGGAAQGSGTAASKPAPTKAAKPQQPAVVSNNVGCPPPKSASTITGPNLPGASSPTAAQAPAPQPCVRIPGWTREQPYNHAPVAVPIVLYDGSIVELPGMTPQQQWGLWMKPGGRLEARPWNKQPGGMRSGVPDPDGCAPIVGEGWPSPTCEQKRQQASFESAERVRRAEEISESACRSKGGTVIDPNENTISEADCLGRGGFVLYRPDAELQEAQWPPKSRGCYRENKWQKVQEPGAPKRLCKFRVGSDLQFQRVSEQ